MNNRTRALAILNYAPYDRLPIVHFGYWRELLINPRVFAGKIGPPCKRFTNLVKQYHIHRVSSDCDGKTDALIPI